MNTNMHTTKMAMNLYSVCRNVLAPERTFSEMYFMATKPSGMSMTCFTRKVT